MPGVLHPDRLQTCPTLVVHSVCCLAVGTIILITEITRDLDRCRQAYLESIDLEVIDLGESPVRLGGMKVPFFPWCTRKPLFSGLCTASRFVPPYSRILLGPKRTVRHWLVHVTHGQARLLVALRCITAICLCRSASLPARRLETFRRRSLAT